MRPLASRQPKTSRARPAVRICRKRDCQNRKRALMAVKCPHNRENQGSFGDKNPVDRGLFDGGPGGTRTPDPLMPVQFSCCAKGAAGASLPRSARARVEEAAPSATSSVSGHVPHRADARRGAALCVHEQAPCRRSDRRDAQALHLPPQPPSGSSGSRPRRPQSREATGSRPARRRRPPLMRPAEQPSDVRSGPR